ncbi:MAG: nitrate ABC transporter, permease protein, partial [Pseudomonadota bacterium]
MGTLSLNQRAALLSVVMLVVGLLIWEAAIPAQKVAEELTEYERLTGGGAPKAGVPPPSQVFAKAWEQLSNPFYDAGPNDKGIGIQIGYSIYRVLTGYLLAAL